MSRRTISSPSPRCETKTSSRPASASQTVLNDHYIHRIAIDGSAVLGSFYDARTECILDKLSLGTIPMIKASQHKATDCIIMKDDMLDREKLFHKIGIHDEPWLNSILNIVPSEGIAALVNYSFTRSTNTRFLYYYHSSVEQSIHHSQSIARKDIPKDIPNTTATHVISTIKLGIQALIVLQLSSDNEMNLDYLLENIARQLITNNFQISADDKPLLGRITVIKVFSNIPALNKTSKLTDICRQITAMKPHTYLHRPLEYTLRTIQWFYPSYSKEKAKYIPLELDSIKIIKQYLLSLSSQIKELKASLDLNDKQTTENRLHEQSDAFQQQTATEEKMYSVEIERIRDLVNKIRCGRIQQEVLTDMLSNTSEQSSQKSIDLITERPRSSREKSEGTNNFDQENIKFLNMHQLSIQQQNDDLSTSNLQTLETVQSSNRQPKKIEKPVSPPTSSNLSDTTKRSLEVDNQLKPPKSPTPSISDICVTVNQENEVNSRLLASSISSKQSAIKNTSPRTQDFVSLEDATVLSRSSISSAPKPSPRRTRKYGGCENQLNSIESSNEQTNNEQELSNISKPPMMTTPQPAPRNKPVSTHIVEISNHQNSSTTEPSEEQPDCSSEQVNLLEPSLILTLDPDQLSKEQPEDSKSLPESSGLPISLSPETVQLSSKQSRKIEKPMSPPISPNLSDPQKKQSISNIHLPPNQKNQDNTQSLDPSISSRTQGFDSVEDLTKLPGSSTSSASQLPARKRRQFEKIKNLLNSAGSSSSPNTESTAPMNEQTNNDIKLSNISKPPILLTSQVDLQTKQESTNIEERVDNQTALKSSTTERMSASEEQSEDNKKQFDQLTFAESLSTEHAPSSNHVENQSDAQSPRKPSPREATPRERRRSNLSHLSTIKYTNVLLLGESGVGKSTFINALVNYLVFETFEQARSNKPLVVMPVSFLMTVGDHFEEKIVRFGDVDSNEDHDHPGQSVTQHCRSYVFQIGTQTKLRIIDTPGMGDTRGLDQDDRNMQHILSFINNLSHLNAICILLKPNESRLNIVLRSYFTRLLNFLGENARNNIVFCFTNTRATFFAPGDTGPLLKKMIDEFPIKDIPFNKCNTFCFDSESFRYLICRKNGIEFDLYQENEYQHSWITSVIKSSEFLEYICQKLTSYSQNEWQSVEHAQFKMNQIIRPMLETTRNILRNIILRKEKPSRPLIKLCPVILSQPSAICYTCQRTPKRFSDFWILPDDVHILSDICNDCDCDIKQHIDVDYKLEYELTQCEDTQSFDKMNSDFEQLKMVILKFGQFYAYVDETLKQNDPILSALERIIVEESQICSEKGSTYLNSTLCNIFTVLKEDYKERKTITTSVHVSVDLPSVYEQIKSISKIDDISEQMNRIKQAQKNYLKHHEKHVS